MNHFLQLLRKWMCFMNLTDTFIQSILLCIQSIIDIYEFMHSLGIEPMTLALNYLYYIWIDSETYRIKTMKASKAYTCWWTSSVLLYIFLF